MSGVVVPQALLFDLGGVLIDIDFDRALQAWQAHSKLPADELRRRFTFDAAYRQHERGEIDGVAYFAHLAARLELDADTAHIAEGWNAIFVGEIAQTHDWLRAAATRLPCHAFSNTNAVHMQAWTASFPAMVGLFGKVFVSHEMGCRKPERRGFDHIVHTLGVPAPNILFFDDLAENVAAAIDAGLQAVQVRSPADVGRALRAHGLVD